jgi:spore maturation protein CgeB
MTGLSILFVGQTVPGSRTFQRIDAFRVLGHNVEVVPTNVPGARYEDKPSIAARLRYRLRVPKDVANAGSSILKKMSDGFFDILWLERAVEIGASTLRNAKKLNPAIQIIWYAEDDMINPRHRTRHVEASMPLYDLWVTTKSFNALPDEVPRFGVRNILFVNNSYDETLHKPILVSELDQEDFGADVSFVGTYEKERAQSLILLAQQGVSVRVWGNGWSGLKSKFLNLLIEDRPVYDDEYIKVICASKINLCFLRKENRDLQTCRSIEIPACGGFMLHERNDEMLNILAENKEAAYFSNDQELVDQCKKWMAIEQVRKAIAAHGHARVTSESFSHAKRLQEILNATLKIGAA